MLMPLTSKDEDPSLEPFGTGRKLFSFSRTTVVLEEYVASTQVLESLKLGEHSVDGFEAQASDGTGYFPISFLGDMAVHAMEGTTREV